MQNIQKSIDLKNNAIIVIKYWIREEYFIKKEYNRIIII